MQHHSPPLSGPAIQPVPNPAKSAPVQATGCQLIQECAVGDSVKGPAEIQTDNIHSPSCIHQAEKSQFSQPFLLVDALHPSDHLGDPPLDLLQQVHVLPVLGTPELDAALQEKTQPLTESYAQEAYELLGLCPACQKNGNLTLSERATYAKHPIRSVKVDNERLEII
ncbi:hypothetical protein DUI87_05742 [Hirundo rustica rustica]|uniref:Uncharacterized protein n=1 Tax=Hirundo rustica rustica TaxID=333673 RepID=A0A3M0KVJ4_HIRRU|nr:hypothetical protein DUI87_05742 [Hirundo rustica rustica]